MPHPRRQPRDDRHREVPWVARVRDELRHHAHQHLNSDNGLATLILDRLSHFLNDTTTADIDYSTLQPFRVTDPNGTKNEVAFDALGRVVKTAVVGPQGEGDVLASSPAPIPEIPR